jgi:hypothetical protein
MMMARKRVALARAMKTMMMTMARARMALHDDDGNENGGSG